MRITLPERSAFRPPRLTFLTNIYHPAVPADLSKPCFHAEWGTATRITQWIEQNVNVIDRPEAIETYCMKNREAKQLYDQNKYEYEKKVMALIEIYSYPRANQSIISLKFASKQIIRRQLDFQSKKINQLSLPKKLKEYLNFHLI